jgi:hypothetical protein
MQERISLLRRAECHNAPHSADDGICLQLGVKPPGLTADLSRVAMLFSNEAAFGKSSANGYERLLLDAMLGHATLFSRRALFTPAFELGENPTKLVRVRGISKRQNEPRVLSLDECHRLLAQLEEEPFRTSHCCALVCPLRRGLWH